ncbi:isocitrate dehydrogenase [Mycolicibacterium mageritense DSM 44476 = CIP 104973]|uniref:3-isopropylmalate dehydrogenase n=1 Tax=Mycolicibacterium mageritense TaxID=53462 RepID=A0ABM7HQP1_MYCME|nr:isocitrate/isopropylmalate family dehydrogenase [Mycolicibacterium mageritense]MCC9183553.1 isocitrate/isopropylmalate dehydrogenase family protein [Mycolicibacterium mageritense]BBX32855.1 3-isopropylmalate dehydrogenase [Mycolicibacterium mageritense]CDO22609.1 3-isopropylmalate dehydrogenase [Mycolicibacterium mageritense DSM 44476 = CIP 104973]
MKIAMLPGDDIGPEISAATRHILDIADNRFGLGLQFETHEVGMACYDRTGTTLPPAVVEACVAADGVILGPGGMTLYPPVSDGGVNIPGTIRKRLDLYANLRPSRARAGIPLSRNGLDVLVVRENTEGFYADRSLFEGYGEFRPTPDTALSLRLITEKASRRIAKVAFEHARARRGHVTVIGKRHVMQVTDGLFVATVEEVAADYPDVELREMDIDAMAADLYLRPERFDVLLTTNMFGDILSNEASALAGGLGLAGALNVGDHHAAANAGHGSAPDIAGQGIANPTGLIVSAALLLDWWGTRMNQPAYLNASKAIESAVDHTLTVSGVRTRDLGGSASTMGFATTVGEALAAATAPLEGIRC